MVQRRVVSWTLSNQCKSDVARPDARICLSYNIVMDSLLSAP